MPYNQLRDMKCELVDQGREHTRRQPAAARAASRRPLLVQRVQDRLEPGRLEMSKKQARHCRQADCFLTQMFMNVMLTRCVVLEDLSDYGEKKLTDN